MKAPDLVFSFFAALHLTELSFRQISAIGDIFNITETNLRSILSRMRGQQILETRKDGRTAYYSLSAGSRGIRSNISMHFHDPDWTGWDGSYWTAAFSVSDSRRRYRIQKKLNAYRFRMLYPGLWLRPQRSEERIETVFQSYMDTGGFDLLSCRPVSSLTVARIAAIYDLERVSRILDEAIETAGRSLESLERIDERQALVEYLDTGEGLVAGLSEDPLLPPQLLPGGWPGYRLRMIFSRWAETYQDRVIPFVNEIIK